MTHHYTHTHCQVAQKADTQTKTCQRVWLPNRTDELWKIKHENTISCIVHLSDNANFKDITLNKLCSGSTGFSFESPKDTIRYLYGVELTNAVDYNIVEWRNKLFEICDGANKKNKPTAQRQPRVLTG